MNIRTDFQNKQSKIMDQSLFQRPMSFPDYPRTTSKDMSGSRHNIGMTQETPYFPKQIQPYGNGPNFQTESGYTNFAFRWREPQFPTTDIPEEDYDTGSILSEDYPASSNESGNKIVPSKESLNKKEQTEKINKIEKSEIVDTKTEEVAPKKKKKEKVKPWNLFYADPGDDTSSQSEGHGYTKAAIVIKITFIVIFFAITLLTAILSKICIFIIASNLRPHPARLHTNKSKYSKSSNSEIDIKWMWAAIIVIIAPYSFSFFYHVWKILFKCTGKLSCLPLLLALILESLHSMALCTLVFYVLPRTDSLSLCWMMTSVVTIPAWLCVLKRKWNRQEVITEEQDAFSRKKLVKRICDIGAAVAQTTVLIVWGYKIHTRHDNSVLAVTAPVCLLVISLASWDNYVTHNKHGLNQEKLTLLQRVKKSLRARRSKIGAITSLWKIAFTIAFAAIFFGERKSDCLRAFFFLEEIAESCSLADKSSIVDNQPTRELQSCISYFPFVVAVICVVGSILCYKTAKSACKALIQRPCFALPLTLVTPLCFAFLCAMYEHPDKINTFLGCTDSITATPKDGSLLSHVTSLIKYDWLLIGLVAYVSFLYVTGHVWFSRTERMASTEKLFLNPLYCGIFFDQSLMTNRRRDVQEQQDNAKLSTWEQGEKEDCFSAGDNDLETARSKLRTLTTPVMYICATMWHETENEMIQMLKSIFRLDSDQSARRNAQLFFNIQDPDYYEFEAHIFFDDAFTSHADDSNDFKVNAFVKQLVAVMDIAASAMHNTVVRIPPPTRVSTPYGGRLTWRLPGSNFIIAHLKDKAKIRHRKRWSQVMYMYYFLGYQLMSENDNIKNKRTKADHTFLLALDGDVDFQPEAIQILVDRMRKNPGLGAACGRIHPIGSGPMVWYQKFEYAISHWLHKATEHTIGCVLCSPGCFSLFRGSALMDDNVMRKYTTPPTEPRHYVQYDQGEDRWLCTLLLQQGYRVEYCAASDSFTFAPEGFFEFYNQRRRWTPSTIANIMDLLQDWKNTTKNNQDISLLYILYQLFLLISGIIAPGTIFLMVLGAINLAYPDIPLWGSLLINLVPVVIFVFLCFKSSSQAQLTYAAVLSVIYCLLMMLVLVGLIRNAVTYGFCSVSTILFVIVVIIFIVTAILHPMEWVCVVHGFIFFFSIPSMTMLLMIYSLANLHVVSWGTREVKEAAPPPTETSTSSGPTKRTGLLGDLIAKLESQGEDSSYSFSFGNLFRCLCCPRETHNEGDLKFKVILERLDDLDRKLAKAEEIPHKRNEKITKVENEFENKNAFSSGDHISNSTTKDSKLKTLSEKKKKTDLPWIEDGDIGVGPREYITTDEEDFWKEFIGLYLFPMEKDEANQKKMQSELLELRNKVCLAFFMINSLFIILVYALQSISQSATNLSIKIPCHEEAFTGEKIEPISVAFTLVFGIMLLMQFIAMLFHRYSTLLHIIAITKIKVKKLKNFMKEEEQEDVLPSVKETLELVRRMQALTRRESDALSQIPEEPDADYDKSDEEGDGSERQTENEYSVAKRRASNVMWEKMKARSKGSTSHQTLSRAFMKNFNKLAHQVKVGSISEYSPISLEEETKQVFKGFEKQNLSTIVKLARNTDSKDHIVKRSDEVKAKWKRGINKIIGGQARFMNIIEEATKQEKTKKEESATNLNGGRALAGATNFIEKLRTLYKVKEKSDKTDNECKDSEETKENESSKQNKTPNQETEDSRNKSDEKDNSKMNTNEAFAFQLPVIPDVDETFGGKRCTNIGQAESTSDDEVFH